MLVLIGLAATTEAALAQHPDFSSPERTIETYIAALRSGEQARVASCFESLAHDYHLPDPALIDSYEIERRVVFAAAEVARWNNAGVVPPARIGDVDLTVTQRRGIREHRFSYLLREFAEEWKIISHGVLGPQ